MPTPGRPRAKARRLRGTVFHHREDGRTRRHGPRRRESSTRRHSPAPDFRARRPATASLRRGQPSQHKAAAPERGRHDTPRALRPGRQGRASPRARRHHPRPLPDRGDRLHRAPRTRAPGQRGGRPAVRGAARGRAPLVANHPCREGPAARHPRHARHTGPRGPDVCQGAFQRRLRHVGARGPPARPHGSPQRPTSHPRPRPRTRPQLHAPTPRGAHQLPPGRRLRPSGHHRPEHRRQDRRAEDHRAPGAHGPERDARARGPGSRLPDLHECPGRHRRRAEHRAEPEHLLEPHAPDHSHPGQGPQPHPRAPRRTRRRHRPRRGSRDRHRGPRLPALASGTHRRHHPHRRTQGICLPPPQGDECRLRIRRPDPAPDLPLADRPAGQLQRAGHCPPPGSPSPYCPQGGEHPAQNQGRRREAH